MSNPIIRRANRGDVTFLIPMFRRFVQETGLPFTFDVEATTFYLISMIEIENVIILVEEEEDDGILTGVIVGSVDQDCCHELCAYVVKMYVEVEFRGLGTSRALVEAFQDEVKKLGASIIFASSTAGMGNKVEKLYVNLFGHYGFETLGRVLYKEI